MHENMISRTRTEVTFSWLVLLVLALPSALSCIRRTVGDYEAERPRFETARIRIDSIGTSESASQ